jgi:protein phosphatase
MRLLAAAETDVGLRRRVNEDRYALSPELRFYVVADGMGGHTAGQVASGLAVEAAIAAVSALEEASASLAEKCRYAVSSANRSIYDTAAAKPEYAGMGTTLVALLVDKDRAALAHVGDSRAYRVRKGSIRQLTDDHSIVADLLRRQEISEDDAREHPHRHVLTRALGVRRNVEPDLAEVTLATGDIFLLCSDGLTTHVEDHEIEKLVAEHCTLSEPNPAVACEKLVELANARGGEDNITVMIALCAED